MRKTVADIEREHGWWPNNPDGGERMWERYRNAALNASGHYVQIHRSALLALFDIRDELRAQDEGEETLVQREMADILHEYRNRMDALPRIAAEQSARMRAAFAEEFETVAEVRAQIAAWERIAARTQAAEADD